LSIGFAAVFYIFLFIKDELNYDLHHHRLDQLYRLNFFGKLGPQEASSSCSPAPAGPLFRQLFAEVEYACRIRGNGVFNVKRGNQVYRESKTFYADSSYFRLFSADLIAGDAGQALASPGKLVITRSMADKYFSEEEPVGQTLAMNNKPYMVAAVVEDYPSNSHFEFDFLLPMLDLEDSKNEDWGSTNYHTYFKVRPNTSIISLTEKMNEAFVNKFTLVLKQYINSSWEDFISQGNYARMELFPVKKIHLYSDLDEEFKSNGSISQIYILSLVGLMILLLACINFINLSTGRASVRAREVGVRKAIGAVRHHLTLQFLIESALLSLLALVVSFVINWILLTPFNLLSGKNFQFSHLFNAGMVLPMLFITLITGFLAGTYPAFFLSSFDPIKVLKGSLTAGSKKSALRNGLVVFQFFISLVLIISSLAIYQQIQYVQDKKLGFNKSQVLVVHGISSLDKNMEAFKNTVKSLPTVKNVSVSESLPVAADRNTTSIVNGRIASSSNTILVNNWHTDQEFVRTMEMKIVEGRDFSKEIVSDSNAILVNQVLARMLGYPGEDIKGKVIGLPVNDGKILEFNVVGVVEDFNFLSLRHLIEPLAIFGNPWPNYMSIRLDTREIEGLLKSLRSSWEKMAPGIPFSYTFLDERYSRLYQTEMRAGKISFLSAVLAVFIALIGLLGLSTFTIQQRIKEIGIRKVLGASAQRIIRLMTADLMVLISVSIAFAFPLGWWMMNRWLNGFAYRTDLSLWLFVIAGISVLITALSVVAIQTLKAALANPVQSLRNE